MLGEYSWMFEFKNIWMLDYCNWFLGIDGYCYCGSDRMVNVGVM